MPLEPLEPLNPESDPQTSRDLLGRGWRVRQVAALMGLTVAEVDALCDSGTLQHVTVGNRRVIYGRWLDDCVENRLRRGALQEADL